MPDNAVWLINAAPPTAPCSKTEIHIFAVRRYKQRVETTELNKLVSVHSHETARAKEGVTSLLMLRVELPTVKTVFKL